MLYGQAPYGVTPYSAEDVQQDSAFAQPVQGTFGLRSASKNWRSAAVVVASLFIFTRVEAAPDVQTTQPDTWTQTVQGTASLSSASRQFQSRAVHASVQYYWEVNDQPPIVVPDTYTQPIQGQQELGQANRAFWGRSVQANSLYWIPDETNGPLPVQPDTWTQPVQGVGSIGRLSRLWWQVAAGMARNWQTPEDVTTSVDTWTQETQGTRSLNIYARARARVAVNLAFLWQTLPEVVSGPLATQPDTWTQPVNPGLVVKYLNRRHSLYWTTAQDPIIVIPPDSYTQPVNRPFKPRPLAQFQYNSWSDLSGPLPVQPDTWTQRIQGFLSLSTLAKSASRAAVASVGYWGQAQDQPIVDIPAQPVNRQLRQKYTIYQGLWQAPAVDVQPETWTQRVVRGRPLGLSVKPFISLGQPDVSLVVATKLFIQMIDSGVTQTTLLNENVEIAGPALSFTTNPGVVGGSTPTLTGLSIGDTIFFAHTGTGGPLFDHSILSWDGITLATGYILKVIGYGTTNIDVHPPGPPITWRSTITATGSLSIIDMGLTRSDIINEIMAELIDPTSNHAFDGDAFDGGAFEI